LQFYLQEASPETFGYKFICISLKIHHIGGIVQIKFSDLNDIDMQ